MGKESICNAGNIRELRPPEEEMAMRSSVLTWKSHGQRSLMGYSPWGCKESDMTEWLSTHANISYIKGNPKNSSQFSKHISYSPRFTGFHWTDRGVPLCCLNLPGFCRHFNLTVHCSLICAKPRPSPSPKSTYILYTDILISN